MNQLSGFLQLQYDLSDMDKSDFNMLRSWVVYLLEKGLTPRSVNRKIASAKAFYNYLVKKGHIAQSPARSLSSVKYPREIPAFVSQESMEHLFDQFIFHDDFCGIRDKLILLMFYSTGIRLSELVQLRLSEVNIYDNTIKVTGKRNKERIIPFGNELRNEIKHYIQARNKEGFSEKPYFFLTKKGQNIYNKSVYRIVKHYLGQVSSLKKRSPHTLRHTFATHMLNNGADINAVKELLGHASLSATEIYTHNTFKKLKNIHKQAHPRA